MWETCYPSTIDRGEHPAVNIGLGQFKILGASWEQAECINLAADYLYEGPKSLKTRCVREVLLLHLKR